MNRASSKWFRLTLLLLTASSMLGQGIYSTRRDGDMLVVFEVSGNMSSREDSRLDLQNALNEAFRHEIDTLVFEVDEYEFRTKLVIRRSLNITSSLPDSTKTRLSCSEAKQIFEIERRRRSQEHITVELRNLTITACATRDQEGVVHVGSGSRVIFENVELVKNRAEGFNHAVVTADSNAALEVRGNSSFSDNHGRVMLVGSGSVVILENSSFRNNKGATNGIVLATRSDGGIQLTIQGSRFERNAAEGDSGGAIWLETSNVTLKDGVQFVSNVADHDGGALFLIDSHGLHTTDTLFENNSCRLGKGGAIFVLSSSDSPTQFRRSLFKKNSASGLMGIGGAISFGNTATSSRQTLQLKADVLFVKNTARVTGGAVFVNGTNATIECLASFVNNTAQGEGGGLFITSLFYSRRETEDRAGFVREASLVSNSAHVRGGGGLVVRGGAVFSIVNSNFSNNMAEKGGAVFAYDEVRVSITNYTLFSGNGATENGGSITVFNGKNMTLRLCRFENNHAGVFGGGINLMSTAVLGATSSIFTGNHAGQGGAINVENSEILRGHDTKTTLEDVIFRNNWSLEHGGHKGLGGAVRLTGAGVDSTIKNCLFEKNTAHWGGCVYLAEAYSTTFANTSFSKNTASLGGALYIVPLERELHGTYDSTNLASCILEENTAARGGAIFARPARLNSWEISEPSNSLLSIEDSTFRANRANNTGGGLFLALMNVSFDGCLFRDNTADCTDCVSAKNPQVSSSLSAGGAVHASDGSSLTVSYTNFTTNDASGVGGAVCIDDALFNCTRRCAFQTNRGLKGGGVFCSLSSRKYESNKPVTLHCHECVFKRNSALKGGGLYALIPTINPDSEQFQACQRFNGSDRNSTRTSLAADGCQSLIFLDPQKMQDNNASVSGHDIFSTQPDAVTVVTENGDMNLVRYVNTLTNEESNAYKFASPAYAGKRNRSGSSLENMNRGNTSEEMSQLDFEVLDYFGQRIDYSRIVVELKACQDDQNCCENSDKTDKQFIFDGEEKRVIDQGMANFANLSVSNGLGGSAAQRLWVCFEDEGEERAEIKPMFIDVSFRECYTMEVNISTTGGCRECPTGHYYANKSNSCQPCPSHATCRELTIIPDGEHWHATSISHRIYDCHPREACIKDDGERAEAVTKAHKERDLLTWTDPRYNQCNTGYEGILCGSCTENHGRWNDICTECLAIPLMWISVFVSVGWNLLVLLLFIYSARSIIKRVHYNQQATSQHQRTRTPSPSRERQIELAQTIPRMTDSFLCSGPLPISLPSSAEMRTVPAESRNSTLSARSILRQRRFREAIVSEPLSLTNPLSEALKIVFNFMQVVYLAALLSENLPSVFRWSTISFDTLNLSEPVFLVADCLLKGTADRAIIRMTLQALFPALLVLFICLIPALLLLFGKRINFGLQEVKLVALCTVYLYFVPEIRTLLKFLGRVRVEDEYVDLGASLFWSVDSSVKFLQGSHAFVFGFIILPLLGAFIIGFPLSLFVSLKSNQHRMQEEDVASSYGFLYKGYESRYYYWEIVIVIRKTVIAVLSVFVQNAELQSVFISLTLVSFLSLHLIFSPFSSDFPGLNILESLSLSVSTLVFFSVSSMLRSHELGKSDLLYAIAWITILVLFITVLAMGVGLFAATQDFLNDILIEKGVYPDKQSVEVVPIATKIFQLLKFYFGQFHSCFVVGTNQQHTATLDNHA